VRAVPVTLWALLVVLVVLPGVLPGAIGLAIYTAAVLVRLFSELLENQEPSSQHHMCALGARPVSAFMYGSLPNIAPGWVSAALYRWEVTARETVVVGIVGAGGLGRLLQAQITSFDYRGVLATLLVLIGLTVFVDTISAALRKTLR
jgi:phosphonate transport system permease protein